MIGLQAVSAQRPPLASQQSTCSALVGICPKQLVAFGGISREPSQLSGQNPSRHPAPKQNPSRQQSTPLQQTSPGQQGHSSQPVWFGIGLAGQALSPSQQVLEGQGATHSPKTK